MRTEKGLERRALQIRGIARREGTQELKEFIAGVGGEAIGGVADDVGMDVRGELETDGEAARAGVGIGVRDERDAGGVREADDDRRGRARDVRGASEIFGGGGGGEGAAEQEAFGVYGAEAGVEAEDGIELLEDVVAEGENFLVGGQGYWGLLYVGYYGFPWRGMRLVRHFDFNRMAITMPAQQARKHQNTTRLNAGI